MIALMMPCSFSGGPPGVVTSCGTQALASSHSPCWMHLLKYSNRSCRDVSDSQPKGCVASMSSLKLSRSGVTTRDGLQIPHRPGLRGCLHLDPEAHERWFASKLTAIYSMTYRMYLKETQQREVRLKQETQPFYQVGCSFNCLCKQITHSEHNKDHMSLSSH